jgi:hypothetical protein
LLKDTSCVERKSSLFFKWYQHCYIVWKRYNIGFWYTTIPDTVDACSYHDERIDTFALILLNLCRQLNKSALSFEAKVVDWNMILSFDLKTQPPSRISCATWIIKYALEKMSEQISLWKENFLWGKLAKISA